MTMLRLIQFALPSLALLAAGCGHPAALGVSANPVVSASPTLRPPGMAAATAVVGTPSREFGATEPAGAAVTEAFTLDLLTYNTWGKPGLLGTDEKARFALMGPAIAGHGIVALQETFTRHASAMAEASGYAHHERMRNWDLLHLNAGLFTLSKYPIVASDFARFKQAGDFDRFANKGVQFLRLSVPGLGEVDVYNTHYQAVQGAKFEKIRLHDNSVLDALVKQHEKGNPTFVMGDFNMLADSPEYRDLEARLNFRDAFAEANPGAPGYTSGPPNPHKETDATPKRIDYIFVLPSVRHDIRIEACEVTMAQPVGGKVLSDHYGVKARLSIRAI